MKIRNIITALALLLTVAATADEPAKAKTQAVDLSSKTESYETWFARYDENKDDKLTMDEFRGGKMLFTGYDADRDGILTREEIKKAKSMSRSPSFRTLDTDKDGFVNRREWTGTQEEFDAVDVDNDGVWSKADQALEKEKTRAKGLLERMDTDKDGVVSTEEWTATGRDVASFRRQDLNLDSSLDLEELAAPVKAKKQ